MAQASTSHRAWQNDQDWGVKIEPGEAADYAALAAFHYRGRPPRVVVRVLRAMGRGSHGERTLAGVLVVAMPPLNAWWRRDFWPDAFGPGLAARSPRERAIRVNDLVRTIARVVVSPRWRGLGLARRLVEAYLREPITPLTEALATMGRLCPFFEHAGMRASTSPAPACDVRLSRVLASYGVAPESLLAPDWTSSPRTSNPRTSSPRTSSHRELVGALRRWAQASRATRSLANADEATLAWEAGCRLVAGRPVAYAAP
ncbi:MAG: hypothetical protein SFZ23_00230 [Planctomycetota bacterium]|nr:hypothetical protein [Planctomycetota bacterium]